MIKRKVMNFELKTFASTALLATLAGSATVANAHPGYVDGGGAAYTGSWLNNTPTGYQSATALTKRGVNVDAIRIGHGCNLDDSADGKNDDPVVANTWIFPQGLGQRMSGNRIIDDGMAPMSTGCSDAGNKCTGAGSQPSVARIPDSTKKAHLPAGQGTATTLAAELVKANVTCTTNAQHVQTCVPGTPAFTTDPISNLGGRFNFQGNLGYFKTNTLKTIGGGGFYAKGPKFTAHQIADMGITSAGAPYHNALQVLWAQDRITSAITPFGFSATSCARKLVIRAAGADICRLSPSRAVNNDGHSSNYWFGGPTKKFTDGHGVHENFWLGYTLIVRDTTTNPYPDSCTDKVKGDYDLVVMPTKHEIDAGLPFPGFANSN